MKRSLNLLIFFLSSIAASSQYIYKIKADSVLITNDSCNAELNLENSTRNIKGFLFNRGNGRTEFRQGAIKLNDSTYLIGSDTIMIPSSLNNLIATNGLTKIGDSVKLGGDLLTTTTLNLKKKQLLVNLNDGINPSSNNDFRIFSIRDTATNYNDIFVIHKQVGSVISGGISGGSVFVSSNWVPTSLLIPSGWFPNYVSFHQSNTSSVNMSGTSLVGYASFLYNNLGTQYGKFIHFYAGPGFSNSGTVANYYGLYIDSLKGANVQNSYSIYTTGKKDTVYNAGPIRWTRYLNNGSEDSVLSTDINGNIKLKVFSPPGGGQYATSTNNLSFFSSTTSSQLAGVISDETGTGTLVFGTSPTLTTPNIGAATGASLTASGAITSSSSTAGIGYSSGAGGTVTQSTSKTTGVTINKVSGQITMNNAALGAGSEAKFTVTNSAVSANDVVIVNIKSGGTSGSYLISVTAVSSGSFDITISNVSGGSLSQALVINFVVIKGVNS